MLPRTFTNGSCPSIRILLIVFIDTPSKAAASV
jgi:hypothetical protein